MSRAKKNEERTTPTPTPTAAGAAAAATSSVPTAAGAAAVASATARRRRRRAPNFEEMQQAGAHAVPVLGAALAAQYGEVDDASMSEAVSAGRFGSVADLRGAEDHYVAPPPVSSESNNAVAAAAAASSAPTTAVAPASNGAASASGLVPRRSSALARSQAALAPGSDVQVRGCRVKLGTALTYLTTGQIGNSIRIYRSNDDRSMCLLLLRDNDKVIETSLLQHLETSSIVHTERSTRSGTEVKIDYKYVQNLVQLAYANDYGNKVELNGEGVIDIDTEFRQLVVSELGKMVAGIGYATNNRADAGLYVGVNNVAETPSQFKGIFYAEKTLADGSKQLYGGVPGITTAIAERTRAGLTTGNLGRIPTSLMVAMEQVTANETGRSSRNTEAYAQWGVVQPITIQASQLQPQSTSRAGGGGAGGGR